MIPGFSPAGYYPGAKQMNIQTAFSPENKQPLSAQLASHKCHDNRIGFLSSVIKEKEQYMI
jgi:hypothetical protein